MNKKEKSKSIREKRIMQGKKINPAFCNICGFRVRSINHLEGTHHNAINVPCHRGR